MYMKNNSEIEKAPAPQEAILSEKIGKVKWEKEQVNSDETQEDENGNKICNKIKTEENNERKIGEIQTNNIDNRQIQRDTEYQPFTNYDKLIDNMLSRLNSLEQEKIKSDERINSLEQEKIKSDERINSLKQENIKRKNEIMRLNDILGRIQLRGMAKNFLKSFNKYLSNDEKKQITEDSNKRGEVTLNSFKREFRNYKEKNGYKIIEEIIKKSGDILAKGNTEAHTINLDIYSDEINPIKNRLNIKEEDEDKLQKVFYLLKIKVENDSFENCFGFLEKYYEKELNIKFLRGQSIEDYFK